MKVQAAEMPGRNRLNSNSEFSREAENLTIPATIASRTGKGLPNYGQRFTYSAFVDGDPPLLSPCFIRQKRGSICTRQ
jgi:hypothetical protein